MLWLIIYCVFTAVIGSEENKRPNIVIFIVDDLGVGDVGCFGNTTLHTPNIDRLCAEGVKLDHDKAAAPICTPSRTGLLTGRYAIRSGMVAPFDRLPPVVRRSSASAGLPKDSLTFASVIREVNYTNGYFGKWHLGIHCEGKDFCHFPLSHGFQYYYGMPLTNMLQCSNAVLKQSESIPDPQWLPLENRYFPQYIAASLLVLFSLPISTFRKCLQVMFVVYTLMWVLHMLYILVDQRQQCILMRNREVIQQPVDLENITQGLTEEATRFIERTYQQSFMAVVAYHKVHVALKTAAKFRGSSKNGDYGDSVKEVDWSVGVILEKLKQLGVERDTFVYFTSDHGPALYWGKNGGYAGRLRGGKGTNWEGGIRVPTIVKWQNRLPAGAVYKGVTSGLDLFPTLAHVAGANVKKTQLDGRNFIPDILDNSTALQKDRFLFHYQNTNVEAVTYNSNGEIWKAHYKGVIDSTVRPPKMVSQVYPKPLLFDLLANPLEREAIDSESKAYSETMFEINDALKKHKESIVPVPHEFYPKKNQFSFERQMCCNFPLCSC